MVKTVALYKDTDKNLNFRGENMSPVFRKKKQTGRWYCTELQGQFGESVLTRNDTKWTAVCVIFRGKEVNQLAKNF